MLERIAALAPALGQAKQLLADVSLPLKKIAAHSGFTDDDHMRRVFQKRLGITPKLYRERFATTGIHEEQRAPVTADVPR